MSRYFQIHGKQPVKKYKRHGRTKQSQKDETNINLLLERAAREGTMSHLEKYGGVYADYSEYDFEGHKNQIAEMQSMFEELPAEVKREFQQSPKAFFDFVTDEKNAEDLPRLLPELAKQGTQLPPVGQIQTRQDSSPAEQEPQAPAPSGALNTSPPALEAQEPSTDGQ